MTTGSDTGAHAFRRVPALQLTDSALARFAGQYEFGFGVEVRDGGLTLTRIGKTGETPLTAVSPSRFVGTTGPFASTFEFMFKDAKVTALNAPLLGFTANRVGREP